MQGGNSLTSRSGRARQDARERLADYARNGVPLAQLGDVCVTAMEAYGKGNVPYVIPDSWREAITSLAGVLDRNRVDVGFIQVRVRKADEQSARSQPTPDPPPQERKPRDLTPMDRAVLADNKNRHLGSNPSHCTCNNCGSTKIDNPWGCRVCGNRTVNCPECGGEGVDLSHVWPNGRRQLARYNNIHGLPVNPATGRPIEI